MGAATAWAYVAFMGGVIVGINVMQGDAWGWLFGVLIAGISIGSAGRFGGKS